MFLRLALLPLSLLTVHASSVPAQTSASTDWPHWRGPDRDGVSKETDWTPAGKAEPLWSVSLGLGYSSVSIADGRLYTLGHDAEAGEDQVVCLEADTGSRIWSFSYPAETMANYHGGGSLTTPTVDGDVVFVSGRSGRCFALDARTGDELWRRDYKAELELADTQYGFGASPLVQGEHVILALAGTVLAVDKRNGDVVWRTPDVGEGGYATPLPFALGERAGLAVFLGPGLSILDAGTGEELGLYPFRGEMGSVNAGSPIVVGDRIFVSAAYGVGSVLVQLDETGEPAEVWHTKRMRNKVSGCTLWDGHVYGFDESMLKCISWEDGSERWRVRGLGMGAVAVAGGRLIVLSSQGELIVADASPDGFRELSRRKVLDGGVYWTTPVLVGGLIYCRNSLGDLVCLDHRPVGGAADVAMAAAPAEEESPGGLPEAETLFRRHAELVGGDSLRARTSLRAEGWFENNGAGITRSPATQEWMAPGKWKLVIQLGEFGAIERGFDGEVGWSLDPFFGNQLVEGDGLRELAETRQLHRALDWRGETSSMRTTGRARFGGRDCWVVAVESGGGALRTLYFDVESGFLAGRDAEIEHMVVFADYRDFEGVRLPGKTTYLTPDVGEEEVFVIESVAWDAVEASAFERPDEVRKMLRTPEEIAAAEESLRARWGSYLGTYGEEQKHVVHVADGSLMVDIEGFRAVEMAEPDEEGRFYFPPTNIYFVFELDDKGVPTAAVMHNAPDSPEPRRMERID